MEYKPDSAEFDASKLIDLYNEAPAGLQAVVRDVLLTWKPAQRVTVEINETRRYSFDREQEALAPIQTVSPSSVDAEINENIKGAVAALRANGGVGLLPVDEMPGAENMPPELKSQLNAFFTAVTEEIGKNLKGLDPAEIRRRFMEYTGNNE